MRARQLCALALALAAVGPVRAQTVLVSTAKGVVALVEGRMKGDDVMQYGNWYGPGWWGGGRDAEKPGDRPPVDALDAAAMAHDFAYMEAERWGRIYGKHEEHRLKAIADAYAVRDASALDDDPSRWDPPAADPEKARRYRARMITAFSYQSGFFQGAGKVGNALAWTTSPLESWELDTANQLNAQDLAKRVAARRKDWYGTHAPSKTTAGSDAGLFFELEDRASPPAMPSPSVAPPPPAASAAPAPVASVPAPRHSPRASPSPRPPARLAVRLSGPTRATASDTSRHVAHLTGGAAPFTYQWWIDGQRTEVVDTSTSVTVKWATIPPGEHTLEAVVIDARGATARARQTVRLAPSKLLATCTGPTAGRAGVASTFVVEPRGGTPPYRFEWYLNGMRQTAVSAPAMSAAWPRPGRWALEVRLIDRAGARATMKRFVDVAPGAAVSAPAAPAAPRAAGVFTGAILDRSTGKTYRGLTLRVSGETVTGRMRAGKDQGTVLDWTFTGSAKNFRMKGGPLERKLSGEIRGTVLGVHAVQGSFLVNAVSAAGMAGTWNVRFRDGARWHGPFEVAR